MKIENDKYYTPDWLARRLVDTAFSVIGRDRITEVVEPSAGNGAFSSLIPGCIAYDIEPEAPGIIRQDFLALEIPYKEGRMFIGNPPFGSRNTMSFKFYKKCVMAGDFIAFVQPISMLNNTIKMHEFDLVHSEDLGEQDYSGRRLHCCFNVWTLPDSGLFNDEPDYTLKDITIIEHRRKKGEYHTGANKPIPDGYDYAMCNWGSGCLGKVPSMIGEYAQEVYFYCHRPEFRDRMIELLSFDRIRAEASSISAKKISVMRLYKYLKDNIEGIE